MTGIASLLALVFAALFGMAGLLHIAGAPPIRNAYRRWQFARGFHYVAGTLQLIAALFLAVPQTRIWGGILAGAILFVAAVSLLNHRRYLYAAPVILLMVALAPAMASI